MDEYQADHYIKLTNVATNLASLNSDAPEVADAVIKPTNLAAHPSRGVVAEYIEARNAYERATAPTTSHGYPRSLKHGDPVLLRYRAARAALQAAALPAVPDGEKWHITEAWIHGGTVAELKLQRRFRGEDEAEVTDLCGQYVRLAATPAHDQPEGSDND